MHNTYMYSIIHYRNINKDTIYLSYLTALYYTIYTTPTIVHLLLF